ncbi:ATP synthase subunit b, mitochondrial-like [Maniola hyperantus]|uniref:ATP synthase subunit b, mitochondrial-like n=1 Tax=Aphantopus hyperantus TaxID=2795564 RepID=UPI001567F127|nr:ATP synthase subunit b, mitochondrial-like [Maniola hyperantus]
MIIHNILKLLSPKQFGPSLILAHTVTCPTRHQKSTPVCGRTKGSSEVTLKRAEKPGKVRMGFIPEEWFLFFHPKTGVTGPYVFGIVVANYLFSKEIYVMEHEYYSALSIVPIMYLASTRLGPELAKMLDKDVDDFADALEKSRKNDLSVLEKNIKDAKEAQGRAEGQKLLMDAKKENIAMQLEAAYRERCMRMFLAVTGRMDYQVNLYRTSARIQQKWMLQWILHNVMKSITPDFEKAYLNKAIADVASLANRTAQK